MNGQRVTEAAMSGRPGDSLIARADSGLPDDWLIGNGEVAELFRSTDWSGTPLGPRDRWPQSLKTLVNAIVASDLPMNVVWGPERLLLFNDAYVPILGGDRSGALGRPAFEIWPEARSLIAPILDAVMEREESFRFENQRVVVTRRGYEETVFCDLSYCPVRVEDGAVGGVFVIARETTPLVEADRLLHENEARLAANTENAPTGILVAEMPTHRIVFANDRWLRLFELDRREVFGKTPVELGVSTPELQDWLTEELGKTGRVHGHEVTRTTRSGETRVMSLSFDELSSGGRPYYLATVDDITDRKRAEETLREREAQASAVLASLSESVIVLDADLRLKLTNRPADSWVIGRPLQEVMGLFGRDFRHATRDRNGVPVSFDDMPAAVALRTGQPVHDVELSVPRSDGSISWISANAEPIRGPDGEIAGVVSSSFDITARKEAEAEKARILREVEERRGRLQAIVDSLPAGLLVTDPDGNAVEMNHSTAKLFGSPSLPAPRLELIRSKRVWVTQDGREIGPEDWPVARALRGEASRDEAMEISEGDGESRTILVSASPIRDSNGTILGAVAIHQDITELRRLREVKEALESANERLQNVSRRKDAFLAVLSHELRNPLAPIRNSLYVLERAVPGGEQAREARAVMERQVAQMNRLVEDLLDVTRIARGKAELQRERLDLNELARRVTAEQRPFFVKAGIELRVLLDEPAVWVKVDEIRLSQVIRNLLQNARDFTPRGGTTVVSVEADMAFGQAIVSVRDTGRGIPPELLPHVFEQGFEAENHLQKKGAGLGIGLTLAKGLVDMHGGMISAVSDGPGKGSTYTFTIPLDGTSSTGSEVLH